jgi:hypothetical protein
MFKDYDHALTRFLLAFEIIHRIRGETLNTD